MKKKFGTNKGTGRRRERKCKCRKESSEVVESWESSEVEECLKCGKVEKRLKSEVESVLNVLHEAFVFQSHGACYSLNKNKRWQTFDNLPFKQKHNIYFQNNKILQLSGDENNSKTHKTVNFKVILELQEPLKKGEHSKYCDSFCEPQDCFYTTFLLPLERGNDQMKKKKERKKKNDDKNGLRTAVQMNINYTVHLPPNNRPSPHYTKKPSRKRRERFYMESLEDFFEESLKGDDDKEKDYEEKYYKEDDDYVYNQSLTISDICNYNCESIWLISEDDNEKVDDDDDKVEDDDDKTEDDDDKAEDDDDNPCVTTNDFVYVNDDGEEENVDDKGDIEGKMYLEDSGIHEKTGADVLRRDNFSLLDYIIVKKAQRKKKDTKSIDNSPDLSFIDI